MPKYISNLYKTIIIPVFAYIYEPKFDSIHLLFCIVIDHQFLHTFYIGNSWSDINSRFNEQFTLSSYIWTKYIFETHSVKSGEDQTECGVRCELSATQCDFFTIASGKCYLGRYTHWNLGTVQDGSVPTTYHKSGMY